MANVRELKKDINFLAAEILSQGYLKIALMDSVKEEDVQPIMVEAIEMRNEFIARTNNPNGVHNKKLIKEYYTNLRVKLMEKATELLDKLQAL